MDDLGPRINEEEPRTNDEASQANEEEPQTNEADPFPSDLDEEEAPHGGGGDSNRDGDDEGEGNGNGDGNGDGDGDGDDDDPLVTRGEMKTILRFIKMLEDAKLESQFSPDELEAFRNPSCPHPWTTLIYFSLSRTTSWA
jgi:hypothetical protein